jgi:hypothetical protein
MGQIWLGDAAALARVLRGAPRDVWPWRLARMLREAERAGDHLARWGRAHPLWGNGSLMAVALRRRPPPEPDLSDGVFRAALCFVLLRL